MTDISVEAVEAICERLEYPVSAMRPTLSDGKEAATTLRALSARVQELEAEFARATPSCEEMQTGLTRFEYIGLDGREITLYGTFSASFQDDNRTLKVFGDKRALTPSDVADPQNGDDVGHSARVLSEFLQQRETKLPVNLDDLWEAVYRAKGFEAVKAFLSVLSEALPPTQKSDLHRRADEEAEASRMRPEVLDPQNGWRDMDDNGFEIGTCQFTVRYRVTTYTSGNELRGPAVFFGDYASDRDARQALADCGFTNGQFGWRRGPSDATIQRVVDYGEPINAPTPHPATDEAAVQEAANSVDHQQQRGQAWDIIDEAIAEYDGWMLDDDYNADRILTSIISRMKERRALSQKEQG